MSEKKTFDVATARAELVELRRSARALERRINAELLARLKAVQVQVHGARELDALASDVREFLDTDN